MPEHQPNIHDHPWLQAATGVDVNKLGAVMLPVEFDPGMISSGYAAGFISEADLVTANDPAHFWIKGDVSAHPHITLLYGLLIPAYEQAENVYKLMREWRRPAQLPIFEFDMFPSTLPGEDYGCIVAKIGDSGGALASARGLLSYLPHVDTFQDYVPHATVAYVKPETAGRWLEYLNKLTVAGQSVAVPANEGSLPALDLGSKK